MLAQKLGRIFRKSSVAVHFDRGVVCPGQGGGHATGPTLGGARGVEMLAGAGGGGLVRGLAKQGAGGAGGGVGGAESMGARAGKIRGGLGVQTLKNCLTSFAPVKVGFQGRHVATALMSPTIFIIVTRSNIDSD